MIENSNSTLFLHCAFASQSACALSSQLPGNQILSASPPSFHLPAAVSVGSASQTRGKTQELSTSDRENKGKWYYQTSANHTLHTLPIHQ
jgi:hypothetical protein